MIGGGGVNKMSAAAAAHSSSSTYHNFVDVTNSVTATPNQPQN